MANPFVILLMGTVGMIIKLLCTKHTCEAGKLLLAHFKKLIKKKKSLLCSVHLFFSLKAKRDEATMAHIMKLECNYCFK